jgi:hypothetical protein
MHQKSRQLELALEDRGEAPRVQRSGEAGRAAHGPRSSGEHDLMERVVARENARKALERVRRNKGSAGIDGLKAEELEPYLREHWEVIRERLLAGRYQPSVVKRQLIPKNGGGVASIATGSGRGVERTKRCARRRATSRTEDAGWWTWTSRSSSTA